MVDGDDSVTRVPVGWKGQLAACAAGYGTPVTTHRYAPYAPCRAVGPVACASSQRRAPTSLGYARTVSQAASRPAT